MSKDNSFDLGPLGDAFSAILGPVTNAATQAWSREVNYLANMASQNYIPTPGMLIDALNKGLINKGAFDIVMSWNGISLNDPAQPTNSLAWQSVVNATRIPLPLDFGFALLGSGVWTEADYANNARRRGLRSPGEIQLSLDQQFLPDPSDILANMFLGSITEQTAIDLLSKWGILLGNKLDRLKLFSSAPGANAAYEAYRTRRIDLATCVAWLNASGVRNDKVQDIITSQGRENAPPIAQVIDYAQSVLISADFAKRWGLFSSIPDFVKKWNDVAGGAGVALQSNDFAADGNDRQWGDLSWAASRQRFSRQEAAALLRRTRPQSIARLLPSVGPVQEFSQDDYYAVLRSQGFTKEQLPYIQALSYELLTARDIKRGIKFHQIDQQAAADRYVDLGYLPADAATRASIDVAEIAEADYRPIASLVNSAKATIIKSVSELYRDGMLTQPDAHGKLLNAGVTAEDADTILQASQAELLHQSIKESIEATKHAYLSGAISAQETAIALTSIGIVADVVPLYLARWNAAKNLPHRLEQSSAIVRFYSEGLLSKDQAVARLANLGIALPDITLLIVEANQKHDALAARQQIAAQKHDSQAAAALNRIAKQHLTAAQLADKQAQKIATPSRLVMWLKDGIINDKTFTDTLKARGVSDDVIIDLWEQATHKATKANGKAAGS